MAPPSKSKYESLADAVKNYSRSQIREGSTQLQNNLYDIDKQKALRQAIRDIRTIGEVDGFGTDVRRAVKRFENRIAAVKKYSIGNCHEYALMALEYMVDNQPDVNAEVYHIDGGDHVFLVIGRSENSNPNDPLTWGDDALICDPWADSVYPAREYLTKTKNFFAMLSSDGKQYNRIEDFNPKVHALEPIPNHNSKQVINGSFELNKSIVDYFKKINDKYCSIYEDLASDLEKIATDLGKKYGAEDPNVIAINSKIKEIKDEIDKIKLEVDTFTQQIESGIKPEQYHSYKQIQQEAQQQMRKMKTQLSQLDKNKSLSSQELTTLSKHRNEGSFITMIMKFLHIEPASSRKYKASMKKADDALSRVNKIKMS